MRITRLELMGYVRLSLNNITRLVYTPQSIYQLILGTNGSGKSSIINELSPLPAHHSNYSKGGYKDISILHQNRQYQLVSRFSHGKTGKHSFIVDGEDYNKGGTAEVQLALVEQHFNYTRELHEVLTGQLQFTTMETAQRRKWITALSAQDYGFALSFYKLLAGAARDELGAAKHLKRRLTEGHDALKALGSIDGLEDRAQQLREELDALMVERNPHAQPVEVMRRGLESMTGQVGDLARRIVELVHQLRNARTPGVTNYPQLEVLTHQLDHAYTGQQVLTKRLTAEYTELETAVHGFQTSDGITPETIDGHLLELSERVDQARNQLDPEFQEFPDATGVCEDLHAVLDQLVALFYRLPDNQDRRFSQATTDQHRQALSVVQDEINRLDGLLLRVNRRLANIEQATDTTCPSCTFVWKEGVQPGEVDQLTGLRSGYAQRHQELTQQQRVHQVYLEEAQEASALYNEFRALRASYPRLDRLWTHIGAQQWHLNAPASHVHAIQRWGKAAHAARTYQQLLRRQQQLTELAQQWSTDGGISHLAQRMTHILAAIEQETQTQNRLRTESQEASAYLERVRNLDGLTDQLQLLIDQIHRQFGGLVESIKAHEIRSVTDTHHNELGTIQRQLTEHRTLIGVVRDLEEDHVSVAANRDALALLAKALSPTEGLIAEQLTGFINCLTAQLNSIIAPVWSHDLTVLPCGLESGELDYRFPLKVHGHAEMAVDVRRGSKGQQQMINLAFHLTVMLYAGLEGYPLFLDEPGEGFDEQHRVNLMSFIKHLMENQQHSQLFMVSHYASGHGAFNSAEVMVLDSSNIAVPGRYNDHVVME
jgi:DNA repair exonuclease SbcCD ATPase subunit